THGTIKRHSRKLKANQAARIAYENYLSSFVKIEDKRYLPNENIMRSLVPLRAAVGTVVLSPSQFEQKHMNPLGPNFFFSEHNFANDPLINAILSREKQNLGKDISTIIFVDTRDSKGFSVSGYIDFEQSARKYKEGASKSHPWMDIFLGRRRLEPNQHDMSFVAWYNGKVFYNETENYKVIPDAGRGLCFRHKGDGSVLTIERYITEEHPRCEFIESPKHGSAAIYDHRIRRKC
ncbi:hypothetical protein KR018_007092, partial [Drosophila ironensis]